MNNVQHPIVPGCTVYLHPHRDPHNPNGYHATRNTPFVCHTNSQNRPAALTQVQPPPQQQHAPQPIPVPQTLRQPQFPQLTQRAQNTTWMEKIDEVSGQYRKVADKINDGSTLHQALAEQNLTKEMFRRRRVIAETYLALPDAVMKILQKEKCGGDLGTIFILCKSISKTANGKRCIRAMAMNGTILPVDI